MFKKRHSIKQVEEGKYLSPKFDKNGLIPAIVSDYKTGDILMHGYMNKKSLKKTIETKESYFWSRSRNKIWHKGKIISKDEGLQLLKKHTYVQLVTHETPHDVPSMTLDELEYKR